MAVQAIPKGYHTLTPYMTVRDAARAIEFYKQAFGAEEKGVMKGPDGKVMHAELRIGDSIIMLGDEYPQFGSLSPQSIGGSGMGLHIYVEDVDSAFDRATRAEGRDAGRGHVLGRPLRQTSGSLRPQMVDRDSQARYVARRDRRGPERIHETNAEKRMRVANEL
jgi:catechol 2,3-dioxygenase-like lactoylglutathione lyase family enzyme